MHVTEHDICVVLSLVFSKFGCLPVLITITKSNRLIIFPMLASCAYRHFLELKQFMCEVCLLKTG